MKENNNPQKEPFLGTIKGEWEKISSALYNAIVGKGKWLLGAALSVFLVVGCKTPFYLPTETNTQVNLKDSTVLHIKDSIRITEATRYKDMAWLGDSLKIQGSRSRCWAVADTARGAIVGGLEEDKVEEKTRIIFKDRWKVRDSLVYKEVPVPYEVEKIVKVVPLWAKILSTIGGLTLLLLALYVFVKFGLPHLHL